MNKINTLTKIKSLYPSITNSEKQIADFILNKPEEIYRINISGLAGQANVSLPTVSRFAQRLGFNGFKDFKVALIRDIGEGFHFATEGLNSGSAEGIVRSVFGKEIANLKETLSNIDCKAVEETASLIMKSERVLLFSVSSSIPTTTDFAWKLSLAGFTCWQNPDVYSQVIMSQNSRKTDLALGVSFSGQSREVVECMRNARQNGVKTVCLTTFMDSPITRYSDIRLYSAPVKDLHRKIDLSSRIAHMVILDAVYLYILLKDKKRVSNYISKAEEELLTHRQQ